MCREVALTPRVSKGTEPLDRAILPHGEVALTTRASSGTEPVVGTVGRLDCNACLVLQTLMEWRLWARVVAMMVVDLHGEGDRWGHPLLHPSLTPRAEG